MSVRTVYELRVLIQADGAGDFCTPPSRFDELQFSAAQQRFAQNVAHAKGQIGKPRTFLTHDGNEFTASPHTICVELWHYKSGRSEDGSAWASRPAIVGELPGEPGMREVITERKPDA